MDKLTKEEQQFLDSLDRKLNHVRAAVRGVVKEWHPALFLAGEGGTSKSYTVLDELQKLKAAYIYHNTRMTARGLVDALERNPTELHLIEDAETLLDDRKSFGVLRSACWSQSKKKPMEREVTWTAFKTTIRFIFTGGIIVISNADLATDIPEIRAIKSRIHVLGIDVNSNEVLALAKKISLEGYRYGDYYLSPAECMEVYNFIVAKLETLRKSLDLRILINGFRDYLQWKTGDSSCLHWTALLEGRMAERVQGYKPRKELKGEEAKIALEIHRMKLSLPEKVAVWTEKTGLNQAAYYRALKRKK